MSDIKLFHLSGQDVTEITGATVGLEKQLQHLFEANLDSLLGVRFLASEFRVTDGRIDTLGLDENNCPVIIEFKRQSNENIINQGLFYLDWLMDHQADFKLLVMKEIGQSTDDTIDWSAPRLVCVAADFTRYDAYAIKQMNRNIELIRYRKFGDDLLMLDLLTASTGTQPSSEKNPKRSTQRDHETLISEASGAHKERFEALTNYLHSLGDDVLERHLVCYTAFKRIKNFACVELRNTKKVILVFIYADLSGMEFIDGFIRDVSNINHFGTGNVELTISSDEDLERAKPFLQTAYDST